MKRPCGKKLHDIGDDVHNCGEYCNLNDKIVFCPECFNYCDPNGLYYNKKRHKSKHF